MKLKRLEHELKSWAWAGMLDEVQRPYPPDSKAKAFRAQRYPHGRPKATTVKQGKQLSLFES